MVYDPNFRVNFGLKHRSSTRAPRLESICCGSSATPRPSLGPWLAEEEEGSCTWGFGVLQVYEGMFGLGECIHAFLG